MITIRLGLLMFLTLMGYAQNHPEHPKTMTSTVEGPASVHNGLAPTASFDSQGRLWVVFAKGDHIYLSGSDDLGKTYEPPVVVNKSPLALSVSAENRPCLALDQSGMIYIAFSRALTERFSGHLMFTRSRDRGQTFEPLRQINDDNLVSGHAFPSITVTPEGEITLAWIDGRDHKAQGDSFVGSSIYAAQSKDQGANFTPNQRWVAGICQCCHLALQLNQKQRPVLLWRHIFGDHIRDHALGQYTEEEGFQFKRLTEDQWHIEGCPHQGPALALDANDRPYFAWYTVKDDSSKLYYGTVDVHGVLQTRLLDQEGGMHPAIHVEKSSITLVWIRPSASGNELFMQSSVDHGKNFTKTRQIAETPGLADHPSLLQYQDRIYVTWQTETGFNLIPI